MIYVTAVHMADVGSRHDHIAEVKWRNPQSGEVGRSSRATMVDWIKNKGGDARVTDGGNEVRIGVVEATPPYIRTYADGTWTDNLLALPRC
ncbi:MAG TPA: DUF3892 domain-containing protein [Polyangiales bacterium]|nr:DUF3892 domain-containing protein [Polyangiales bacterium]